MRAIGNDQAQAQNSRLRFVFSDTVLSLGLSANATLEDVARTLGKLSKRRYGNPVAIDVTFDPPSRAAHPIELEISQ